tara:strand:- start:1795 stop:2496 length:702 start_codon:yes stop_codon:yes gene_type:complete
LVVSQYIKRGILYSIGTPAIGLGLSMFTFGAFLKSSGFTLFQSFSSTFFAFALPGQFVMADLLLSGGSILNIFFAVLLTNARLFPMTINLIPIIKNTKTSKWKYFLISHLIAVTAWISMFASYKKIEKDNRFDYFLGLGGSLWISSILFTVLGFICSDFINGKILLGLVFFNPLYFLIMTLSNIKSKKLLLVFILSACLGPLLNYVNSSWSILIAGFISGTLGFFIFRFKNGK